MAWAVWQLPPWGAAIAIGGLTAIGVPICSAAAKHLRSKDPGAVVWDEIAGVLVTFCGANLAARSASGLAVALLFGFLLFRLFDIVKPPPARWLERLPGGWGIMADDLAAGAYAALALWGILRIGSGWLQ